MQTTCEAHEMAQACSERAGFYRFLSRLYYKELDEQLMEQLAETFAVLPLDDEMSEAERAFARGCNKMVRYIEQRTADTLTQSRCDFARVFLGAGSTTDDPVSPFESVYTSEEHLLMQGARDAMSRILIEAGLALDDDFNMPEDHISFEFQYQAHLLDLQAKAFERGDASAAQAAANKAAGFFHAHIENWVPRFCEAAAALAKTPFYRGLCECVVAWVVLEADAYAAAADAESDADNAAAAGEVA